MDLELEELFAAFLAEAQECLASMESGLLQLEERPEETTQVDLIFRAAHTMKGNSSSLGFADLSAFAHEAEELLHRVRGHELQVQGELITLLLTATDVMKRWLSRLRFGEENRMDAGAREVYERLREFGRGSRDEAGTTKSAMSMGDESLASASAAQNRAATIRVQTTRMDKLLNLTGQVAVAAGRVRQRLQALPLAQRRDLGEVFEDCERLLGDVHETVMRCRMVAIGPTFRRHVRTVRDLANAQGKRVRLDLDGEDVEVDVSVIEALADPLVHMIRNAIDHGIESPQARLAAGKTESGALSLRAYHERGTIVVEVADDGAGIPRDRVRQRALAMGLPLESLNEGDLLSLIFEPGFTTAENVTETSGRGVGMDVVRRNVEKVRGRIALESREGKGTKITMRLPLTLAVIPGFVVGVAGEQFIIPLADVDECVARPDGAAPEAASTGVMHVRGEAVPYVRLREYFGFEGTYPGQEVMVIVERQDGRAGFVVDEVIGESQTVIKPLTSILRHLRGVTGMAVMGNGSVAMVLESAAIFRDMERTTAA